MTSPVELDPATSSLPGPSDPTWVAWSAAALLVGVAAFEAALASGAPWGAAAWGGTHEGVLPPGLRVASVGSVVVNALLAALAVGRLVRGRRRATVLAAVTVYSALGVVANLATPSPVERAIWAPVTVALTILFALLTVRERRAARRRPA